MTQLLCTIYRSSKIDEMYLYVDRKEDLARVPEALLARFGRPEPAMTLLLNEDRKLARADVAKVMASVRDQGFYLQMPPEEGEFSVASPEFRVAPARLGE